MSEFSSNEMTRWICADECFRGGLHLDDPEYVVLSGELDLSSRACALQLCGSEGLVDVVVDLSELSFMDCAGYGALIAARSELRRRGGSLVVTGAVGEPLRLLMLFHPDRQGLTPLG